MQKMDEYGPLRSFFDWISENHQPRTITNPGHHTLVRRTNRNFPNSIFRRISVYWVEENDKKMTKNEK